ncbi:hypothetical protein [Catenovulum sediminis]|uniref:Uncharacterized protein n=1 Tax=Catenovulum sediminis TaxID=1740262 RepID=A0ABV1RFI1_9ALTE
MKLNKIVILPAMAIARMGSSEKPLDNYEIKHDPKAPLDFRKIKRAETFIVNTQTGEITETLPASDEPPNFKDNNKIRPVAPFLEVFAVIEENGEEKLSPLDTHLLKHFSLAVKWHVKAGNYKVYRRTTDENDKVTAELTDISDHKQYALNGYSPHFIKDENGLPKSIPFGKIQFIKPNKTHPEIRLRYTPGKGLVYGSTPTKELPNVFQPQEMGGVAYSGIEIPPERIVYDSEKGLWNGKYTDNDSTLNTLAQGLYAAYGKAPYFNYYQEPQPARGYLDDACDGIITIELTDQAGHVAYSAKARFCSSPPIFAPDSEFVRTVQDDLEQVLLGPDIENQQSAALSLAQDIVRRAYETVRFMNLSVLNGDPVKGRPNHADTMVGNDSEDLGRAFQPIMAPHSLDTLSITALHQQLYTAMEAGIPPWFYDLLRKPDEVADLTDKGRRKMPAMMSGADARYLALTYRQIDLIKNAGKDAMFGDFPVENTGQLTPKNLTAHLHYRGQSNPPNTHINSSVGNCCPGLEFDFRSVWKRAFVGITLVEHDNYVLQADAEYADLQGRRLLSFDIEKDGEITNWPVVVQAIGPSADGTSTEPLRTDDNPDGVVSLEWSNTLAYIWKHAGQKLKCYFTKEKMLNKQVLANLPADQIITKELEVRNFFEEGSTLINEALAEPGELTQGLCSPWQNDFRECVCYYWASSRPDYVNVEPAPNGGSQGDNWMQKKRTGQYVVDDYKDNRLINYQDLFMDWEALLKFQIGGRDAE